MNLMRIAIIFMWLLTLLFLFPNIEIKVSFLFVLGLIGFLAGIMIAINQDLKELKN